MAKARGKKIKKDKDRYRLYRDIRSFCIYAYSSQLL